MDQSLPATPAAPGQPPEPVRIFSPRQVTLLGTLLSPVCAGVMAAMSLKALGRRDEARSVLLQGIGALLLIVTAVTLLYRVPGAQAGMLGAAYLASRQLAATLPATGVIHRSWWSALGISVAVVVAYLSVYLGVVTLAGEYGPRPMREWVNDRIDVTENESVIFGESSEFRRYRGASMGEARKVGDALQATGYFDGTGTASVYVASDKGELIVCFVVTEGAWNEERHFAFFEKQAALLATELKQVVSGELCDSEGRSRRKLKKPDPAP